MFGHGVENDRGQLGDMTTEDREYPIQVFKGDSYGNGYYLENISQISAKANNTAVIDRNSRVYAWGDNTYGQLGQNTSGSSSAVLQAVKKSNGESITNAVAVAAADNYSLALTADGIVYAWGDNTYGVMGNGTKGGIQKSAVAVAGVTGDGTLEGIYAIAASPKTAVAISKDGHVYSWGNNDNGQIGDATHFERLYPVMQSDINNAKAVSAGDGYTVVQTLSLIHI